jgi:hypothetical protein
MAKHLIFVLLLALFTGCSVPGPRTLPSWYTSPPQDYLNFYAVAIDPDETKAKNKAILNLRQGLLEALNKEFTKSDHKLGYIDEELLAVLARANEEICNTIPLRNVKVSERTELEGNTVILIQISRESLFETLEAASTNKMAESKAEYEKIKNLPVLQKYAAIKPLVKQYAYLAAYTQFKEIVLSTFRTTEDFLHLKELRDTLGELRSTITFYVLSDANSISFVNSIKEALIAEGLSLDNKMSSENGFKLLITSSTLDSMDYSFMQSKNLVKFNLYNTKKEEIAFRQHTFIGKSRKSYRDAKEQASVDLGKKVKKIGIFDFIGITQKK